MFFPAKEWVGVASLLLSALSIQADALTRAEALQIALEHNPEVVAAHAAWEAEQARALQTWALPAPELELEYEGLPGAFDLGRYEQRTIGFSQRMTFPIKWWQHHQAANRLADAVRLSVYETTRLNIARDVQMAYDRVLTDQKILLLTNKHVQLAKDFLERAQKRFDAGDVPKLGIMRAEVALVRLENKLAIAQNAVFMSQAKVNVLLGRMPNASLILADSLDYEPATFDLNSLYAQALRRRSDLRATTRVLESAKATRTASFVSFVPDLSLSIARQTAASPAGRLKSWRTGLVLELPLWAMFEERGEIAEASAQYRQATAEKDRVKLRVLQEVDTAYSTFQATAQRMAWMQKRIRPTAEAAYDIARRSYDEGEATYLDLLEAQRDLIETSIEYVETLFEYRLARTQLFHAIGGNPVSPIPEN